MPLKSERIFPARARPYISLIFATQGRRDRLQHQDSIDIQRPTISHLATASLEKRSVGACSWHRSHSRAGRASSTPGAPGVLSRLEGEAVRVPDHEIHASHVVWDEVGGVVDGEDGAAATVGSDCVEVGER